MSETPRTLTRPSRVAFGVAPSRPTSVILGVDPPRPPRRLAGCCRGLHYRWAKVLESGEFVLFGFLKGCERVPSF